MGEKKEFMVKNKTLEMKYGIFNRLISFKTFICSQGHRTLGGGEACIPGIFNLA